MTKKIFIFFSFLFCSCSEKVDLIVYNADIYTVNDEKTGLQNVEKDSNNDLFYNIKYSGLDLEGNRYILKAKKAVTNKVNQELVKMDFLDAVFYFKDGLMISSDCINAAPEHMMSRRFIFNKTEINLEKLQDKEISMKEVI